MGYYAKKILEVSGKLDTSCISKHIYHEDRKVLLRILTKSKQLYLLGSKTKADHDVVPVYGSLNYHVLQTLNLATQVKFTIT